MAESKRIILPLEGVYCAACATRIKAELLKIPGVESAAVHLPTRTAFVAFAPDTVTERQIVDAIEFQGYGVLGVTRAEERAEHILTMSLRAENRRYAARTLAAFVFTVLIAFSRPLHFSSYTAWLVGTLLWAWCGAHYHIGLRRSLKTLTPNLNTLISISITAAYFYSTYFVFFPEHAPRGLHHLYWAELSLIVLISNIGRWADLQIKKRSLKSVAETLNSAPRFARVRSGTAEKICYAGDVRAGDVVVIRPGEQIPSDGEVLEGVSTVDESLVSGDASLVGKVPGDKVFGGTFNKSGLLVCRTLRAGEKMSLSWVLGFMHDNQTMKEPVHYSADSLAYVMVPVMLLASAAAFYYQWRFASAGNVWLALNFAVAVLVSACPCAAVFALPMALLSGYARAAEEGFSIKNSDIIGTIGDIDTVVLDKTGIITNGRFAITAVHPVNTSETDLIRYALIAEKNSTHPLARAVVAYAKSKGIEAPAADSAEAVPVRGVKARYGAEIIRAGRIGWLMSEGVGFQAEKINEESSTILGVASNEKFIGYFEMADTIRPEARDLVEKLRKMKKELVLVSGDKKSVVSRLAGELGIKEYYAEVMPSDKARIVEDLQSAGKKVAVAGSGFTDTPALARADMSMATVSGAKVAVKFSDITLAAHNMSSVSGAISLIHRIRRISRQNVVLSCLVNLLVLPLAAGIFYPARHIALNSLISVMLIGLPFLLVLFNSLRLRKITL